MSLIKTVINGRTRFQHSHDPSKGLTHQEFKKECDINFLIEEWAKTGVMPVFDHFKPKPVMADVSDALSFQELMDLRVASDQAFDLLPPDVKSRYKSPLDYLQAAYEAQLSASHEAPHSDSLDVTVLGDTKSSGGTSHSSSASTSDQGVSDEKAS